jgi:hypothetical protein
MVYNLRHEQYVGETQMRMENRVFCAKGEGLQKPQSQHGGDLNHCPIPILVFPQYMIPSMLHSHDHSPFHPTLSLLIYFLVFSIKY